MSDADRGPDVTDREILSVFANADERRLQVKDVADELPLPIEILSDRLDDLYERGLLVRDDDGPGVRWHLAPDVDEELTIPEEEVETEVEAQASKTTGAETSPREEETPETPPPDPQEGPTEPPHDPAPDEIEAFDPPGTAEERDLRRGALRRAYVYLRKRGTARREDFEDDVFPQAPGAYDSPDEGWWEDVVRPGLDTLPDVATPEGDGEWRFTGDDSADASEA